MAESFQLEQRAAAGRNDVPVLGEPVHAPFRLEVHGLPGERTARHARAVVRETLRNADVDGNDVDDAELAVGELAANAVSYANGPYEIRFVTVEGRPAWCEVVDGDAELAGLPEILETLHTPEPSTVFSDKVPRGSGHGLAIVHQISGGACKAYPTVITSTGQLGKAVAFALPVPRPAVR